MYPVICIQNSSSSIKPFFKYSNEFKTTAWEDDNNNKKNSNNTFSFCSVLPVYKSDNNLPFLISLVKY